MEILLTIAIPTYNRSAFLERCLNSISLQKDLQKVEVLISNNASTDKTLDVIKKYAGSLPKLTLINNKINMGLDFNVSQCYEKSSGKYIWLIGDDDYILPKKLQPVLNLLKQKDVGLIHLVPVQDNPEIGQKLYDEKLTDLTIFEDPLLFFQKFHFWATFISSNIINKSLIKDSVNPIRFKDSFLPQLSWVIPAIFQGPPNIIVYDPVIACEPDNTGGYQLATVFGKNYTYILNQLIKDGINPKIKDITLNHLFNDFFPLFLKKLLNKTSSFKKENHFRILLKIGMNYKSYWKSIFPIYVKHYFKKN